MGKCLVMVDIELGLKDFFWNFWMYVVLRCLVSLVFFLKVVVCCVYCGFVVRLICGCRVICNLMVVYFWWVMLVKCLMSFLFLVVVRLRVFGYCENGLVRIDVLGFLLNECWGLVESVIGIFSCVEVVSCCSVLCYVVIFWLLGVLFSRLKCVICLDLRNFCVDGVVNIGLGFFRLLIVIMVWKKSLVFFLIVMVLSSSCICLLIERLVLSYGWVMVVLVMVI